MRFARSSSQACASPGRIAGLGGARAALFVVPALIVIALFLLFPAVWTIYLGLTSYRLTGLSASSTDFVGVGNYLAAPEEDRNRVTTLPVGLISLMVRSPTKLCTMATFTVTLATAHPAKFPEAVERATGLSPALPARVGDLFAREESYATVAVFRDAYGNRWDLLQPKADPP